MYEAQRRFPRVPVRGTVRAILRRVAESDTLPVTLREVSEGGLCVVLPGNAPDNGARVTLEMALWRQVLYLPANVVWSRMLDGSSCCGLKLHLEVTDAQTRRVFAGWVRNQSADAAPPTKRTGKLVPVRETTRVRPRRTPPPERPYDRDPAEMETSVTPEPPEKSRGQELFDWLFNWKR